MKNPAFVEGYFDQLGAKHKAVDFRLELERQRAGVLYLATEEPLANGQAGMFSQGGYGDLYPTLAGMVLSCSQVSAKFFESEIVGLSRGLLDRPFVGQVRNLTAELCLGQIAASAGLGFLSLCPPVLSLPKDLVFYGDVRAALDQVALVFGFKQERWSLDPLGLKLMLLPGQIPGPPVPLDPSLVREEWPLGVEMPLAPRLRPFLPVVHRGQAEVIDKVVFDQKKQTARVTFAGEDR